MASSYSQLHEYAYQDPLLGIPNQFRFMEILKEQGESPENKTLALIDLNDFSGLNAAFGHEFGDNVLIAVSTRLHDVLHHDSVFIARTNTDLFAVVGPDNLVNPEILHEIFSSPFKIGKELTKVFASFGMARLPTGSNPEVLIKNAQLALKQSRLKRTTEYYSESILNEAKERVMLLYSLREAFDEGQLFVVYQPQVNIVTREAVGAEALLRWSLRSGEFVSPDKFIPVAEHSGLIVPIGEFVLHEAFRHLKHWQNKKLNLKMSVNVSQVQLSDPNFLEILETALREEAVDPKRVVLEITESTAMLSMRDLIHSIQQIRNLGIDIAIDDFGTGYSSLAVLRQLDIQYLKIDKAFIDQLDGDESGGIARLIIELASSLKIKVLAEGVQTEEQRDKLVDLSCDYAQGYLFGRPMSEAQFTLWLKSISPPRST